MISGSKISIDHNDGIILQEIGFNLLTTEFYGKLVTLISYAYLPHAKSFDKDFSPMRAKTSRFSQVNWICLPESVTACSKIWQHFGKLPEKNCLLSRESRFKWRFRLKDGRQKEESFTFFRRSTNICWLVVGLSAPLTLIKFGEENYY